MFDCQASQPPAARAGPRAQTRFCNSKYLCVTYPFPPKDVLPPGFVIHLENIEF